MKTILIIALLFCASLKAQDTIVSIYKPNHKLITIVKLKQLDKIAERLKVGRYPIVKSVGNKHWQCVLEVKSKEEIL